jgi:quercetin dioxygenase-like cupin family protein
MKRVDADTLEWEEPPRGYYLTDVKQKVLWEDEKTGAIVALVKFPPGIADKVHSHPEANQFLYGLSGEIELRDGSKAAVEGIFVHIHKGEKHGATTCTEESTFLFYWDGPPTPQVDE